MWWILGFLALGAGALVICAIGLAVSCQYVYRVQDPTTLIQLYLNRPDLTDRAVFLKPTKTATRAIERSFAACDCSDAPIFLAGHHQNPSSLYMPAREYYVVMRHPYERALSGFAFRKQGGENGDEEGSQPVRFVRQYETLEQLVTQNPTIDYLPLLEPKHQYVSYFKQKIDAVRPITPLCYDSLDKEWVKLLDTCGCETCALQVSNTSASRKHTLGPNTKHYIDTHLAGDLYLYEKYCGTSANVTFA